jgi:hypothetical protein
LPGTEGEKDLEMPRLTRKSVFARTVKLCPRCLKPLEGQSELGGWLVPQTYYCRNCGYSGAAYLEGEVGSGQQGS